MSGEDDARALLEAFADFADPNVGAQYIASPDRPPRIATVDPAYGGASTARVTFDGEGLLTTKAYPTLARLRAGDRVVMLPVGRGLVIIGVIGGGDATPAGTYIDGAWAAAPAGYLLCDGSVQLRATYPALFAVVGTTYNTGGETGAQFRLPNAKGRAAVHRDSGQVEFDTLGEVGGAKTHTLLAAEMPSHTHSQFGGVGAFLGTGLGANNANWVGGGASFQYNNTTAASGGGGAHNNLQPYIVVNRAIRY